MRDKRYRFIISTIKDAGVLLEKARDIKISSKNNDYRDIVTNVDIEVSEFISNAIKKSFGSEVVYSEEAPLVDITSGSFWSIDPIDGTASFARGIPHFAIVIVYIEKGMPVVGAIYNPKTLELFSFQKGKGAFLNDEPVSVSKIRKLSQAHIFLRVGRDQTLWDWGANTYKFLLGHANKTANFGSAALDMCYVGAGRIEASIYGNVTVIDVSAAIGFVREAGGIVVGLDGTDVKHISLDKKTVLAVNNTKILSELRDGIDI